MNDESIRERLPETWNVIQEGIERQFHTGCQLYISVQGDVVANCGIGQSSPGQPMTSDTINLWLSSGKPLTVVAILRQWELGKLELDDRVSQFIPEFGTNGKEPITIRHLLTHTGGFRDVDTGWPTANWADILARICAAPLESNWIVGRTAGYHTSSSWFVLGEILSRVTGVPYEVALRNVLLLPAKMDETWAAFSSTDIEIHRDKLGWIFSREGGELKSLDWHELPRCCAVSPGASLRGPVRELGRFYEMLLNDGAAQLQQVISPQTVAAMTARHRVFEFDLTLAHKVDFGLGVIVDSKQYGAESVPYGYGKHCSTRTFGHGGAQSSQGWCDPENQLVVAYFFNGRPGEAQHNRRARRLNEALYQDLNFAFTESDG